MIFNQYRRVLSLLILLAGAVGLMVQGQVTYGIFESRGQGLGATVFKLASYFTILTNVLLTVAHGVLALAPRSRVAEWLARPWVQGGLLLHIGIVGAVYVLVLAALWDPQGSQWWVDHLLHRVTPLLQAGYWLTMVPKARLPWSTPVVWLVYPALYLPWALIRGAATGDFPYPFIDAAALGWPRALINSSAMTLIFLAAGLLIVAASRWMSGPNVTTARGR